MTAKSVSLLGVLADTHNNADNTHKALDVFRARHIDQLIHCGDVTGPHLLEAFAGFQVWLVRGNNDHDGLSLRSQARRLGNVHYMGGDAQLEFGGHAVAVAHGDDGGLIDTLVDSRLYEWVFFGHSHHHSLKIEGPTKLLNPGALGGRRPEPRCLAVVDLARGDAEFVEV